MPWAPLGMQRLRQAQEGASSSMIPGRALCLAAALVPCSRLGAEMQTSLIRRCSTSTCPRGGSTCSASPRTFLLTLGVGQHPAEAGVGGGLGVSGLFHLAERGFRGRHWPHPGTGNLRRGGWGETADPCITLGVSSQTFTGSDAAEVAARDSVHQR